MTSATNSYTADQWSEDVVILRALETRHTKHRVDAIIDRLSGLIEQINAAPQEKVKAAQSSDPGVVPAVAAPIPMPAKFATLDHIPRFKWYQTGMFSSSNGDFVQMRDVMRWLIDNAPFSSRDATSELEKIAGDPKDWDRNNRKWKDEGL